MDRREYEQRRIIARTILNFRNEAREKYGSAKLFSIGHRDYRLFVSSYLLGLAKGLNISIQTRKQLSRILKLE